MRAKGDLAAAESLSREALEGRRETLGNRHPSTLTSIGSLGLVLKAKGDLAAAEPLHSCARRWRGCVRRSATGTRTRSPPSQTSARLGEKGVLAAAELELARLLLQCLLLRARDR